MGASIVPVHARESRRARAHIGRIHKKGMRKDKPSLTNPSHASVVIQSRPQTPMVSKRRGSVSIKMTLVHAAIYSSSIPASLSAPSRKGTPKNSKLNPVGCIATAPR